MNELGSLSEIITKHKPNFTRLLQVKVSSTLDLHLPDCIIDSDSLSSEQLYDELCLHAYAHKKAVITLARNILTLEYQIRGKELPEPNVVDDVLKITYMRVARKLSKDFFRDTFRKHLKEKFYDNLPERADYTGIQYLAKFLPLKRLPKIRKQNQYSQRRTIERQFILKASEFTRYKNGKKMKRKRGYGQHCAWAKCYSQTEFKSVYHYLAKGVGMFNPANACGLSYYQNGEKVAIRTVRVGSMKNNKELFFVCSKQCSDALRVHLRRQPTN